VVEEARGVLFTQVKLKFLERVLVVTSVRAPPAPVAGNL
jgi:hypothetical protein